MSKRIDELPDVGANSSLAHFFAAQASGGGAGTTYKYDGDALGSLLGGNKTWLTSWIDQTPFSGFELSRMFYTTRWAEADAGIVTSLGITTVDSGTAAQAPITNRGMLRTLTQTSAASAGGVRRSASNNNPMYQRGSAQGENGFLLIDIFLPFGTNWDNTGVGTGTRWISGITSSATSTLAAALGSDNPTNSRLAFMRSHVNGGLTETNWWFSAKDGTTENRLDTGVAFSGNSWYATMIACAPQGSTVYFAIKNLTGGNDSGVLSTSSNLPAADTFLYQWTGFYNIDAVSRVCYPKSFISYVPNMLRAFL